jgi:hypothetical protein
VQLRDSSSEIHEALTRFAGPILRKPRDVKRYVNVFRFYAYIQRTRQSYGLPSPEGPDVVAKLALLPIAWPEWVSRVALRTELGSGTTMLEDIEAAMHGPDEAAALRALAVTLRLPVAGDDEAPDDPRVSALYRLLRSEPQIGKWASLFL